jgi:hypothetical protein
MDFLLIRSKFYPDMFRHPQGAVSALYATQAVFCVMGVCGNNPHKPITQNTAWVGYKALTTP